MGRRWRRRQQPAVRGGIQAVGANVQVLVGTVFLSFKNNNRQSIATVRFGSK